MTVDNVNATYVGGWSISTNSPGYFGVNYRHDSNGSKGTKSATFTAALIYAEWLNKQPVQIMEETVVGQSEIIKKTCELY